ncbi:MAG: sulfotransferase [bacterium]
MYHRGEDNAVEIPGSSASVMKTVIYIASDVRSGSTMLDNLLSNHPDAESVGELGQLTSHLNKGHTGVSWNWTCSCGDSMEACPVWTRTAALYERKDQRGLKDVQTRVAPDARSPFFHILMLLASLVPVQKVRRWLLLRCYRRASFEDIGRELHCVIDAFRGATGAEIFIDSSKRVAELHALIAAKPSDVQLKLIHLVRDGRAVLYSKNNRSEQNKQYNDTSFKLIAAIRGWCYINLQILNTMCFFDSKDRITIRYEDLCRDREATLKKICSGFDLTFDEAMLHLSNANKHNVGGSPHRFTWNAATPIRLDERWRQGLSVWKRFVYYLVGGLVHKRLGY